MRCPLKAASSIPLSGHDDDFSDDDNDNDGDDLLPSSPPSNQRAPALVVELGVSSTVCVADLQRQLQAANQRVQQAEQAKQQAEQQAEQAKQQAEQTKQQVEQRAQHAEQRAQQAERDKQQRTSELAAAQRELSALKSSSLSSSPSSPSSSSAPSVESCLPTVRTNELKLGEQIGRGSSKIVYSALVGTGAVVAAGVVQKVSCESALTASIVLDSAVLILYRNSTQRSAGKSSANVRS